MKFNAALLLILIFSLQGCNDCSDISCFTPPQPFNFNFVKGEKNVFESLYSQSDVRVVDNNSNQNKSFDFTPYQGGHLVVINTIGFDSSTEDADYTIMIGNEPAVNFTVLSELINEDCCTYTKMSNFDMPGFNFIINDEDIRTVTLD